MSSIKRRQVTKTASRQTQIQFPQTKGYQDLTQAQRQEFSKKLEAQSYGFDQQIGAKDTNTPYRSVNRVNSLLKSSPYLAQHGHAKLIETPSKFFFQVDQIRDSSKPSSATTAYTYAPSEYSSYKNDYSQTIKNKRESKLERKNQNQRRLVGQKREAQLKLPQMEYWMRFSSSAARHVARHIKLRDKKTGQAIEFSLVDEDDIEGFKQNPIIRDFDMTKLEVEYDYDTDSEQLSQSAKMLWRELQQAIEFYIKDDPFKLVDNILL